MSVTSTTNRKSYSGDAVTTSFATNPVVFFDSSDLVVSVISAAGVETALTENTHYTVTGGDGSTGTVNLAGGSAPYGAPAVGVTLLILRVVALTQPVDFVQNDGSDAEVQETAYDRLTMMVQQLDEVDDRSLKVSSAEAGTAALTELPFDRAGKFLAFDASKNLIAAAGTTEVPVSAFMETVLDDATAADARTTLGAVGLTGDEAIAGVKTFSSRPIVPTGLFAGYLNGMTMANGTDATNDINIAAGSCRDSTDVINIVQSSAFVKQLDAGWAPGSAAGFRNSAAAITNTTYHIYAVSKAGGADPDYYAHTSTVVATVITALQAETGGASYLYARRIGSIVRVSNAIKAFVQTGDHFDWTVPVIDVSAAANTAVTSRTLTLPVGLKLVAKISITATATAQNLTFVSDPDLGTLAAGSANFNTINEANVNAGCQLQVVTNTSAQVASDGNGANATITISTQGYIDTRGRLV